MGAKAPFKSSPMSFFSSIGKALGKVGKVVGTTALNVGKSYLSGVTGINFGGTAAQTAAVTDVTGNGAYNPAPGSAVNVATPISPTPSTGGTDLKDWLPGFLGVISGNRPVQVEASANKNQLPSWLLPVGLIGGLGVAVLAIFKGGHKGRRSY